MGRRNQKESISPRASRHGEIAAAIRSRILKGELPPGGRLPTQVELMDSFQVSSVTVQRALRGLAHDGFIRAKSTNGTFVVPHPPHLSRYALVFANPAITGPFYLALEAAARDLGRRDTQGRRFECYVGVSGHVDEEGTQRLVADVQAHRLAGIVFAYPPHCLAGTPGLDTPGLPRVAITNARDLPGVYPLGLGRPGVVERAVEYFQQRKCRRVAALLPAIGGRGGEELREATIAAIQARGMATKPCWLLPLSPGAPEGARPCTQLLMQGKPGERPDALLIADDNFVEGATAGLLDAGLRVPEDVEVVAHCNFPLPARSLLPVCRLGYDARQILRTAIEVMECQRAGQAIPPESTIAAMFEDELEEPVSRDPARTAPAHPGLHLTALTT